MTCPFRQRPPARLLTTCVASCLFLAGRLQAERVADAWVDPADDDGPREEWMEQYVHPSRRAAGGGDDGTAGDASTPLSPNLSNDPTILKTGAATTAAAAAAASAWGASVLASAEGW